MNQNYAYFQGQVGKKYILGATKFQYLVYVYRAMKKVENHWLTLFILPLLNTHSLVILYHKGF